MIWARYPEPDVLESFGATNIGRVRPVNSDSFLINTLERFPFVERGSLSFHSGRGLFGKAEAKLFLVADGIGNEPGRFASALAVNAIAHAVRDRLGSLPGMVLGSGHQVLELMDEAVREGQTEIQTASLARPELQNMGTTATLACVVWPRLFVAHVGDSRCYRFRQGRLEQLTTDHTFAQRLMEAGVLDAERASRSQWRNVLWNVLGGGTEELAPEVTQHGLEPNDVLLLCSDGLTNHLTADELAGLLDPKTHAQSMCRRLIRAANRHGGSDNITAVVVRCLGR